MNFRKYLIIVSTNVIMKKYLKFNEIKITKFPKQKPGSPPTKFAHIESYRGWCGDATYMHCILANYTRFTKDDRKNAGVTDKKAFRQEGKLYDVYSYSNFKYVHTHEPDFEKIISLYRTQRTSETGYWYGFDVSLHPSTGQKEYFMPLLDNDMMINKLNIKLELRYRQWKQSDIKRMWPILFTLMSAKIPAKIGFCHQQNEVNSCIPIELAHIIYEFARDKY